MTSKPAAALAALAIIGLTTGCAPDEAPHNPRLERMSAEEQQDQ